MTPMDAEKNSLLGYRLRGRADQILADGEAVYAVYLGSLRTGISPYRVVEDASGIRPGTDAERFPADGIRLLHARVGRTVTELCLIAQDGDERVWQVNCRVPEEALARLFEGLPLEIGPLPEDREPVDAGAEGALTHWEDALWGAELPAPGISALGDVCLTGLSVALPALWWRNQSVLLFALNLALPLIVVALSARAQGTPKGRFRLFKLLWLLPGVAMTLVNARLNLVDPAQLPAPVAAVAGIVTLEYVLFSRGRRRLGKVAAVLALCLLTYAPGAALSINGLRGERLATETTRPVRIRDGWIEVGLEGRLCRIYAPSEVCWALSTHEDCTIGLMRGALGIETWVVLTERPDRPV